MNYLTCNHCGFNNRITHERTVFCKQCSKKIVKNYLDWKKSTGAPSFENYLHHIAFSHEGITESSPQDNLAKKNRILFKRRFSKKTTLFITATCIQLFLFLCLLFQQQQEFNHLDNAISDKQYLSEVNWCQHSITKGISLWLPFKLNPCPSILPGYLQQDLIFETSQKAEAAPSFSVTIDAFETKTHILNTQQVLPLKDAYMASPDAYFISENATEHLTIKNYHTFLQHGSYSLHGTTYLYDNYTLVDGKKTIKIVVSYLKQDPLLCDYADLISRSLYANKIS